MTNFLISFFAVKRDLLCLITLGQLFQSLTPSFMKVFFEISDSPISKRLFSVSFFDRRGLSGKTSFIFMMFKGHSTLFTAFQISVSFIWALIWLTDNMFTFFKSELVDCLSDSFTLFNILIILFCINWIAFNTGVFYIIKTLTLLL